jgi:hypothetical protein
LFTTPAFELLPSTNPWSHSKHEMHLISFVFFILAACLKLLSPRSLDNLVFPEGTGLHSVVKRIIYKSDEDDYDTHHSETNSTYLLQHAEATRFNLFTGFQSLSDREDSFKVVIFVDVVVVFFHKKPVIL